MSGSVYDEMKLVTVGKARQYQDYFLLQLKVKDFAYECRCSNAYFWKENRPDVNWRQRGRSIDRAPAPLPALGRVLVHARVQQWNGRPHASVHAHGWYMDASLSA